MFPILPSVLSVYLHQQVLSVHAVKGCSLPPGSYCWNCSKGIAARTPPGFTEIPNLGKNIFVWIPRCWRVYAAETGNWAAALLCCGILMRRTSPNTEFTAEWLWVRWLAGQASIIMNCDIWLYFGKPFEINPPSNQCPIYANASGERCKLSFSLSLPPFDICVSKCGDITHRCL